MKRTISGGSLSGFSKSSDFPTERDCSRSLSSSYNSSIVQVEDIDRRCPPAGTCLSSHRNPVLDFDKKKTSLPLLVQSATKSRHLGVYSAPGSGIDRSGLRVSPIGAMYRAIVRQLYAVCSLQTVCSIDGANWTPLTPLPSHPLCDPYLSIQVDSEIVKTSASPVVIHWTKNTRDQGFEARQDLRFFLFSTLFHFSKYYNFCY